MENRFKSAKCRWQAVSQRRKEAADAFVYGVRTTGIYCRPTCSSRRPNQENVAYFDTWQEAEEAGFRPCKRCRPQKPLVDEQAELVKAACRLIEQSESPPTLTELATAVNLSPAHFHRLFKKITGVTPKQYAQEKRIGRLRAHLQTEQPVTEAIFAAGFASSSRFYEAGSRELGMNPKQLKEGGAGTVIHHGTFNSYLGWVLIAATAQGICRIDIDDDPAALQNRLVEQFPNAVFHTGTAEFDLIAGWTLEFLEAPEQGLNLPLDIQGTAFQRRVWAALQEIPAGQTVSYSELAERIGKPTAARAVAQACGANTLAVAIPCHRVVRTDGELGGYRWGISRKERLLARETAVTHTPPSPD
jgi:AraC family transcriptional regulator of adaptative response/methylated-DNA-[protein]-cysteine methyltransferase